MALPKRLSSCLKYTKGFNRLADIGTDHALLPITAIEEGYVNSALAIDNKVGPFSIAYDNVRKSNASSKINVLLSDGFDKLDDRVDVAVISGMGGSLISDILSKHTLYNLKRIILQPNNDSKAVREILSSIGFKIIDELIVKENDKFYEIIIIERGDCNYTELQPSFGPINLINQSNYFTERINVQIKRQNELLSQVNDKSRTVIITNQLKLLKEALK